MTMAHDCSGVDCFLCKVSSVSFAGSAMPTRKPHIVRTTMKERELVKDRTAYKSLRDQGIQPARLTGAAKLANESTTQHEIETGRILPKPLASRVEKAVAEIGA